MSYVKLYPTLSNVIESHKYIVGTEWNRILMNKINYTELRFEWKQPCVMPSHLAVLLFTQPLAEDHKSDTSSPIVPFRTVEEMQQICT